MSKLPVMGRELRSQSRQPLTFLLRLVGALSIAMAFYLAFSALHPPRQFGFVPSAKTSAQEDFRNFGVALFGKMNLIIFVSIWLLTPLATADSISRERREGTLPLLQLTRLLPWEIVVGKSFVHMLRASTLFLTMLPWLLIPFLFGGLSPHDFGLAMLLDTSALFLAQAAGLLASTLCRDWLKSVIWAEIFAIFLLLGMMSGYETILENAYATGSAPVAPRFPGWSPPPGILWQFSYQSGFIAKRFVLLNLLTNGNTEYQNFWFMGAPNFQFQSGWQIIWVALNPMGKWLWIAGAAQILAASMAIFLLSILLGAAYVRRTWRGISNTVFLDRLRQIYFTPKYNVAAMRNRLNRSLNRNPIGWLHHHSPSARLVKWSWCLFLIGIGLFFVGNVQDLYTAESALGYLLLFGLSFSSAGSFRNELETGAFELLLVTPIRERQILLGRVGGIWQQFLPAFIIYGAGELFLASGWSDPKILPAALQSVLWAALLYITAPFIGLYFSLRRWNFLVAWIIASLVAMLFPIFARDMYYLDFPKIVLGQFLIAAFFAWRILRRLNDRLSLSQIPQTAAA